jgi:hypothetical protein
MRRAYSYLAVEACFLSAANLKICQLLCLGFSSSSFIFASIAQFCNKASFLSANRKRMSNCLLQSLAQCPVCLHLRHVSGMSAFFFTASISIRTGFKTGGGLCVMVEGKRSHKELVVGCGVMGRKPEEGFALMVVLRALWNSSFAILFSSL